MFTEPNRARVREVFFSAWRAHREGHPLEGIEKLIVQVVLGHPEYHAVLEQSENARERDYFPEIGETNPFLHLGLHIAIEEQLSIDQPPGVRGVYQKLLGRHPDKHAVQHRMMECLAVTLWQSRGAAPSETAYLDCLRRLTDTP